MDFDITRFTKWESYRDLPVAGLPIILLLNDPKTEEFSVCISRYDGNGFKISSALVDKTNRFVNYADREWFKWGWIYACEVLKTDKPQATVAEKLALYNDRAEWNLGWGLPIPGKPVCIIYREHNRFDWAVALGRMGKGTWFRKEQTLNAMTKAVDASNQPIKQGDWRIWYWSYLPNALTKEGK